mmetsp:Transcript_95302/g.296726  ORF Transcript_95302/g.296726 Transcript_95302/m.296726 type:complete len:318 (+) Transcript_95302:1348-2301(+)
MSCSYDAGKVVVQQDNVGRVFRDLRPRDAHGKANVSSLEGRRVVGAVAGHRDDLPVREDDDLLLVLEALATSLVPEEVTFVQTLSQRELVLWGRSGQHSQVRPDLVELLLHEEGLTLGVVVVDELAELLALHGALGQDLASAVAMQANVEDFCLFGDGDGGCQVVTSDHSHVDARRVAALNGGPHLRPQGIFDAHNGDQCEVRLAAECWSTVGVPHHIVQLLARDLVDVLVRQADGAHRAVGERLDDLAREPRLVRVLHRRLRHLAVCEHGDHTRKDDLARTLRVDAVASTWLRHRPRHHLPRRREGSRPALLPCFR